MENNKNLVTSNIISNTKNLVSEYYISTLQQRLVGGAGSCYPQFSTVGELEEAILSANWEETSHPDVMAGCRVFTAPLSGLVGIVNIEDIPSDSQLVADDRKGTGKVSLTVKGVMGSMVETTYLITGIEQGIEVMFTLHPGEPVRPSIINTKDIPHGTVLSVKEAKNLGFKTAKVIG